MKTRTAILHLSIAVAACVSILLSACSKPLTSNWRQTDIVIDGDDADWAGSKSLLKKHNLEFGILNDADFLYLCFVITDPVRQMQVARWGFSVWMDADGGKKKTFGVRYPLGMAESFAAERSAGRMSGMRGARAAGGRPQRGRASVDPEQLATMMDRALSGGEFELLGPLTDQRTRLALGGVGRGDPPLEVAAAWSRGRLVYELKVPLTRVGGGVGAVGIGAHPDKAIGLGLEAPQPDFAAGERRPPEMGGRGRGGGGGGFGGRGRGGGGFGGRGGGRGGGFGGGGRPGGMGVGDMPAPLQIWSKLVLAGAS